MSTVTITIDLDKGTINGGLGWSPRAGDVSMVGSLIEERTGMCIPSITTEQRRLAFALWHEVADTTHGYSIDSPTLDDRLSFSATVLGRGCRSWSDLSESEASRLIDALTHVKAFQDLS